MGVKLVKSVVRESSTKIDGKEIMVTLSDKQEISLKLKGKRSGQVTISLNDLYNHLNENPKGKVKETKPTLKNPLILLSDLRSHNAISMLDLPTVAKFDQIINSLIKEMKSER